MRFPEAVDVPHGGPQWAAQGIRGFVGIVLYVCAQLATVAGRNHDFGEGMGIWNFERHSEIAIPGDVVVACLNWAISPVHLQPAWVPIQPALLLMTLDNVE